MGHRAACPTCETHVRLTEAGRCPGCGAELVEVPRPSRSVLGVPTSLVEYFVFLVVLVLVLIVVGSQLAWRVGDAYRSSSQQLDATLAPPPVPPRVLLTVPVDPMRVTTSSGPGTLFFLRSTAAGWQRLGPGHEVREREEVAIQVVLDADPGVASTRVRIDWPAQPPPPEAADGQAARWGATATADREGPATYRSQPLRLEDLPFSWE